MSTGLGIDVKVERVDGDDTQLLATIDCDDEKIRVHLRKPDGSSFSGVDLIDLGLHRKKLSDLLDAAAKRGDFEILVGEIWIGKEADRLNAHKPKEAAE